MYEFDENLSFYIFKDFKVVYYGIFGIDSKIVLIYF